MTKHIHPPKAMDLLAVKVFEAAGNFQSGEKKQTNKPETAGIFV